MDAIRSSVVGLDVSPAPRGAVAQASQIAAHAGTHQADLLVMGNHGRTSLRYALVGSERVLAELPCPAVVIKPAEVEERPAASSGPIAAGRWEL
jgi:nucleotide-binding universal stress UspA family protein